MRKTKRDYNDYYTDIKNFYIQETGSHDIKQTQALSKLLANNLPYRTQIKYVFEKKHTTYIAITLLLCATYFAATVYLGEPIPIQIPFL